MNMCPSNKRKTAPELCLKGQVFFIQSSPQSQETAKDRISLLGGKVDTFLSRDVTTILVEDNHLLRSQLLTNDLPIKSTYTTNGTVVTSLPYPNNLCNVPSTSSGINFVAANSSNSHYRVLCYARQWGIQVLGIDQFLTWIEPQVKTAIHLKKKSENVSNLIGCFIKFESLYRNHRPCYKMFNNDPDHLLPLKNAKILVKPETCNVILNKPVGSRQLNFSHMDISSHAIHQGKDVNISVKVNDKKPQYNNKVKPKEEKNYCECCRTHFVDLKQHIKSVKHQNFVSDEKNYESVHNVLKMLPTPQDFIDKLQNPSPDSGLMLTNEDTPLSLSVANTPETDYPMPLNLQIKRDNVPEMLMPIDLHVVKDYSLPVTHVLNIKKDEEMPVPLDLHIKKDSEIKIETKDIKQEPNLFSELEHLTYRKVEPAIIQPKIEVPNENVADKEKMIEKQQDELIEDMQCEDINSDPLFDKNNDNATALAQFCLKNLDSYWLENLPCEMDDMVFDDDIFDFDDDKCKADNEEHLEGNFPTPEVAQAPELVTDVSTTNIKSQDNANTSFFVNSPVDIKDVIKNEPSHLPESFATTCKLEKDLKDSLLPETITPSFNDSLLEDKKQIFSIAAFCSDKIGIETPTYSNAIPNKNTEPLFSSESSDDENGNVLISNALNFITNSDNEMKVDKDSAEENSVERQCEGNEVSEQKCLVKSDSTDYKESVFTNPPSISSQIKLQMEDHKTSHIPSLSDEIKTESNCNKKDSTPLNEFMASKLKMGNKNSNEIEVRDKSLKNNLSPARNPLPSEIHGTKQNRVLSSHTIDELLYSKSKNKPKYEESLVLKNVYTGGNNINVQNYFGNFPVIEDLSPSKIKCNPKHFEHSVIKNISSGKANDKNIGNLSAVKELLASDEKIDSKSHVAHSVIKNTCSNEFYISKQNQFICSAAEVYAKDKQNSPSTSAVEACPKNKESQFVTSTIDICPKNKQNQLITSVEVYPKDEKAQSVTSVVEVCAKSSEVNKIRKTPKKSDYVNLKSVHCKEGKIPRNSASSNEGIVARDLKLNKGNYEETTVARTVTSGQLVTKNESRTDQRVTINKSNSAEIVSTKNSCSGNLITKPKSEIKNKKVKLSGKNHNQVTVSQENVSSGHIPLLKKLCENKEQEEINRKISVEIVDTRKHISPKDFPEKSQFCEKKTDQKMKIEDKTVKNSPVVQNFVQGPAVKKFCENKVDQSGKTDKKYMEKISTAGKDFSFGSNTAAVKLGKREIEQDLTVNKKYSEESFVLRKDISPDYSPMVKRFCKNINDEEVKIKKTFEEISVLKNNLPVEKLTVCKESTEKSDVSSKKTCKEKVKKKHEGFLESQKYSFFSPGNISEKETLHKSLPTISITCNSLGDQPNCDVVDNTKQIGSKETSDSKKEVKNSVLVKKQSFSETNVIKHNKKRTYIEVSANPCQYLHTTDKSSVSIFCI